MSYFNAVFHHHRLLWMDETCLICSLNLVSLVLPVCLTYTLLHSQGIQYIPGTFRSIWSWHIYACEYFFLDGIVMCLHLSFLPVAEVAHASDIGHKRCHSCCIYFAWRPSGFQFPCEDWASLTVLTCQNDSCRLMVCSFQINISEFMMWCTDCLTTGLSRPTRYPCIRMFTKLPYAHFFQNFCFQN